jgi:hypothetical protein
MRWKTSAAIPPPIPQHAKGGPIPAGRPVVRWSSNPETEEI